MFCFVSFDANPNSKFKKHARLFGIGCVRQLARYALAAARGNRTHVITTGATVREEYD